MKTTAPKGRLAEVPGEAIGDRLAVGQVLARYAAALDQGVPSALEGVLTEDATWTFAVDGVAGPGPFAGRAAILDFVAGAAAQSGRQRHHLTNVFFGDTDDGAMEVRAYLMLTSSAGGSPRLAATGSCTFALRRVEAEWRIAELIVDMENAE